MKEVRADAKLKNLSEEQLLELWELRHPVDEDQEVVTYLAIASEELPRMVGYTVSLSTLSSFYKWLRQWKRMRDARMRAEQAKLELLQQNPEASLEELERIGQMIFMSETVEDGNVKGFVALMKAKANKQKLELEERRIALLEEKAKRADAAETILGDESLSEEEKAANMRALFGM